MREIAEAAFQERFRKLFKHAVFQRNYFLTAIAFEEVRMILFRAGQVTPPAVASSFGMELSPGDKLQVFKQRERAVHRGQIASDSHHIGYLMVDFLGCQERPRVEKKRLGDRQTWLCDPMRVRRQIPRNLVE
jgi:hypothetical protein